MRKDRIYVVVEIGDKESVDMAVSEKQKVGEFLDVCKKYFNRDVEQVACSKPIQIENSMILKEEDTFLKAGVYNGCILRLR